MAAILCAFCTHGHKSRLGRSSPVSLCADAPPAQVSLGSFLPSLAMHEIADSLPTRTSGYRIYQTRPSQNEAPFINDPLSHILRKPAHHPGGNSHLKNRKRHPAWPVLCALMIALVVTPEGWQPVLATSFTPVQVDNIAHRGASGHAPESTLPAFRLARQLGADWIELDVHQTRDGELVVIHDKRVDRTTNGQGAVNELTLSQLKTLDAGSWFDANHPRHPNTYKGTRIPTLQEVLRSQEKNGRFCIEIKAGVPVGLESQVLNTLQRRGLLHSSQRERVIIQSFDPQVLKRIHQSHPDLFLIQLIPFRKAGSLSRSGLQRIAAYADGIGFDYRRMEREDIRRAHREGLQVYAYTVNQKKKMRQLMDWGVDAIGTDFPDRLRDVKREHH
jgi:glycerophosphoryl diester phosphodiesterase